ncbi:MAG TPA: hypothetical protein VMD77_04060 [Candidatus Baltobacteraceae bacterium]|nr:hypothetical protein [Candidatus Baltobacteraceae bacterium]
MRALNRVHIATVLAGIFAVAAAAPAQNDASDRTQPQASTAMSGPVTSVDQAIDRIVAREHEEVGEIRRYSPIVETYVQDMKPDPEMGIVPVKDHYFLGQAQLSSGIADDSMLDSKHKDKKKKGFAGEFNPFSHLEGSSASASDDFLKMVYVDPNDFDRSHYDFRYAGREFLGEVRCVVFDVTPLPKTGKSRFNGRIWAEDQGFTIVRFNGMFESGDNEGVGFNLHFDSWRMNLQPDVWLPAAIYSQQSELRTSSGSAIRFKAQTRLWGYDLATLDRPADFNQPTANQSANQSQSLDSGGAPKDYSPIEAEREWQQRAEVNVVDRLQRIGLLAPPGEVDKVLETVVNNLEVTNNLDIDVHCRVMLTTTLESFSIGHTIVMSRGLIDTLPDEASLAAVLAQELASIMITKPSTDQWGFNDTTNVTAGEALSRFSFKATPEDVDMANKKALEWLRNSPYKDKLSNAALFLKQLSADSTALPSLIDARLGNGVGFSSALATIGPPLDASKLDQVAALPLGARVKVDPWDDHVELLKAKPVALSSAREKMPFEVTPFLLYLTRYHAPKPSGKSSESASTDKESASQ